MNHLRSATRLALTTRTANAVAPAVAAGGWLANAVLLALASATILGHDGQLDATPVLATLLALGVVSAATAVLWFVVRFANVAAWRSVSGGRSVSSTATRSWDDEPTITMARMTDDEIAEAGTSTTPARKRRPWLVPTAAAAVLLIAAGASGWFLIRDAADPKQGAESACQEFVTSRLKAPATAKFPAAQVKQNTVGAYVVDGAVDAQNGFGATIRMTYTCTVTGDGGAWKLANMEGLDE